MITVLSKLHVTIFVKIGLLIELTTNGIGWEKKVWLKRVALVVIILILISWFQTFEIWENYSLDAQARISGLGIRFLWAGTTGIYPL